LLARHHFGSARAWIDVAHRGAKRLIARFAFLHAFTR
jgi:hypothetical protein